MRTLVIGDKNLSSWSLRPWLALTVAGIPFTESLVRLDRPETKTEIARLSPSGKVPCLIDGDLVVWDSLAICEYAAELAPSLWPAEQAARAQARAVSAEMHAGFAALRQAMPMDVRARKPGSGHSPAVDADIARIVTIWEDCRARHGAAGPFLFGTFSIADAMYAPLVFRFHTHAVDLPPAAARWCAAMHELPALRAWEAAALAEADVA